ncbi:hypothetical protein QR680_006329 [Steinernema hermaphroditum]|uniref:Peptidase S1 domain-containing protein n=1 Tax=Steinernema hermaphroditum TaxID=289476 RepID=A0AA39HV26_9BILA|nr:hypothetical protein QR680_006329 [Steinernema hermaphroditum]
MAGRPSRHNAHPWFASLAFSNGTRYCGATVIGDRWLLTAAHCKLRNWLTRIFVGEDGGEFRKTHRVRKFITHRRFDINRTVDPFDIALIETRERIQFNDYVSPVHLPIRDLEIGTDAVVIGYGLTETTDPSDILLEGHSKIVECAANIPDAMICFGSVQGNACKGDSGGPLLRDDRHGDTWQYGIVSAGKYSEEEGRCNESHPSTFIRVSRFCDWIAQMTQRETEGDIAFNDHVQPIRLADNDLEVGASATAIGYGITETGNMSDQLLEKTARISAPDNCTNGPVFDGHSMICFGSGDGNVCGGDSGGPLLKEDDYGETWQYGVANFLTSPDHTCHKAYPTSFARVSVYCEWIKDKTNQEVLCGHNPDM